MNTQSSDIQESSGKSKRLLVLTIYPNVWGTSGMCNLLPRPHESRKTLNTARHTVGDFISYWTPSEFCASKNRGGIFLLGGVVLLCDLHGALWRLGHQIGEVSASLPPCPESASSRCQPRSHGNHLPVAHCSRNPAMISCSLVGAPAFVKPVLRPLQGSSF